METGSLSAAARALRLAQPTVRRLIAALESTLGLTLFTRAANGLTPTAAAHRLAPLAEGIAAQAGAFARAAEALKSTSGGTVRVTASRVISTHVLPPLLSGLQRDAPDITIELLASDGPEDLPRRAADIALRLTEPRQAALIARRLPAIEIGLFASPDFVDRHGHPADARDLTRWPFIAEDRGTRFAEGFAARDLPLPATHALRCDDDLVQIAALCAGLGIGLCQTGIAARLGLVRVLPGIVVTLPAWLVLHEDQRDVPPVRRVFDHLAATLPGQLAPPPRDPDASA